jgi:hypothetical protein
MKLLRVLLSSSNPLLYGFMKFGGTLSCGSWHITLALPLSLQGASESGGAGSKSENLPTANADKAQQGQD